ncbi:cation diffusion facilitator family transporter [Vulcanococcus sp.]|uniref:cation diffusion facilitator family transporter n=1 Tax=Vulcanococcus sp. TaxID=2856995 RepID=UPI003F6951C5
MALHEPGRRHPQQHIGRAGLASAFRWSVLLNSTLSVAQLVIGIGFGSLALIGDAIHNLGDVAGLTLGWGAERLSTRAPSERFTYGFGRSTQLAALINGVLVAMASAVVVVEAIQRLTDPQPLVSGPVAWAAAAGIAVNLGSASLFGIGEHGGHKHDLNRRAAVMHLLSDALVSLAVLFSALLVGFTGWHWLDPLTAVGVGLAVGYTGVVLIRDALVVLLDGIPGHIQPELVHDTLLALPGVVNVHHVHIWSLSTSQVALTAHICRRESELDDMQLLHHAKAALAGIGVGHSTLQLEPA